MASTSKSQLRWEEEVRELFRPPEDDPPVPGTVSVVYILRRELVETLVNLGPFDGKVITERQAVSVIAKDPHRLFASTILMCIGIDLLATLSYGDAGGIGGRFTRLLRSSDPTCFDAPRARRIWALRNGLVHSFSLRPHSSGIQYKRKRIKASHKNGVRTRLTDVRLALTQEPLRGEIWRLTPRQWLVSVPDLYATFIRLVAERESWFLSIAPADRRKLRTLIGRYGRMAIGLQEPRQR